MNIKIIIILTIALTIRLLFIPLAYHGDLNNNISWGEEVQRRGLNNFYGSEKKEDWPFSAPNQPPLYILLFAVVESFYQPIENLLWSLNSSLTIFPSSTIWFWEEHGKTVLAKLPGILADIGIAYLIYRYFNSKKKTKVGFMLMALWLLNPVTWYNSSIWGQTDTIVNFLGLLAIFALVKRRFILFCFWFTVSLLFKGSLAIFLPILGIYTITQRHSLKTWITGSLVSMFTILMISFWFHPSSNFFVWLFQLYKERILPGEIGYLTANAFNVWWLVDSGKTVDSIQYFGVPARILGFIVPGITITYLLWWLNRKPSDKRLFISLSLTALVTFLFFTRIHERYLFPFFPVATITLGFVPGFFVPYIILSFAHLLNLYHLFFVPSFAPLEALYLKPYFAKILAIVKFSIFVLLFIRSQQKQKQLRR